MVALPIHGHGHWSLAVLINPTADRPDLGREVRIGKLYLLHLDSMKKQGHNKTDIGTHLNDWLDTVFGLEKGTVDLLICAPSKGKILFELSCKEDTVNSPSRNAFSATHVCTQSSTTRQWNRLWTFCVQVCAGYIKGLLWQSKGF